jgi:hypothetical protein
MTAYLLTRLGGVSLAQREIAQAMPCFVQSLTLDRDYGISNILIENLIGMARLAQLHGQLVRATQLCGAVEGLSGTMDLLVAPFLQIEQEIIAAARAQCDEAIFAAAWAAGRAMALEQAIAYALEDAPIG